jgi:hypothetical protein
MIGLFTLMTCFFSMSIQSAQSQYDVLIKANNAETIGNFLIIEQYSADKAKALSDSSLDIVGTSRDAVQKQWQAMATYAQKCQTDIRLSYYNYQIIDDYGSYNNWVEWLNSYIQNLNECKTTITQLDSYTDTLLAIYKKSLDDFQYLITTVVDHVKSIEVIDKQAGNDPVYKEVTRNIDAGVAVIDTMNAYRSDLAQNHRLLNDALEEAVKRWKEGDPKAAEALLPSAVYANFVSALPQNSGIVAYFNPSLDELANYYAPPASYNPPDVSENLKKYRKAVVILDLLMKTADDATNRKSLCSIDSLLLLVEMESMADFLQLSTKETDPLFKFLAANNSYSSSVENLRDIIDQATKKKNGMASADNLIELGFNLKNTQKELDSLAIAINGDLLKNIAALQKEWLLAYYQKLHTMVNQRIERLTDCQALCQEIVQTNTNFPGADKLLVDLSKLLEQENQFVQQLQAQIKTAQSLQVKTINALIPPLNNLLTEAKSNKEITSLADALQDPSTADTKDPAVLARRCELALALRPNDFTALVQLAGYLETTDKLTEASVIWAELLGTNPDNQSLEVALALNLEKQRRIEPAKKIFEELLKKSEPVEMNTAQSWMFFSCRQGNLDSAAADMRLLFTEETQSLAFAKSLALVYAYAGEWDKACKEWENIVLLENTPDNYRQWCEVCGNPHDLYATASKALAVFPDSTRFSVTMADALVCQGKLAEARALLDTLDMTELPWYHRSIWLFYGVTAQDSELLKTVEESLSDIEGAEERDLLQAFSCFQQGKYAECGTLLEKYPYPTYPYISYLQTASRIATGQEENPLAKLELLEIDNGCSIFNIIRIKFQVQLAANKPVKAQQTLTIMRNILGESNPETVFYTCLFEAKFGQWWEAAKLKKESEESFPLDMEGKKGVWNILPESVLIYEQAGAVPVSWWIGGCIAAAVILLLVISFVRKRKNATPVEKG